jgi:hypothetical protein
MASDGRHPNDAGYAAITTRMDAELAQLGPSRFTTTKATNGKNSSSITDSTIYGGVLLGDLIAAHRVGNSLAT